MDIERVLPRQQWKTLSALIVVRPSGPFKYRFLCSYRYGAR